ncbi:LysR family transcriptional regulator [Paracidovorax anthurii]|uniref:Uncharacterized protein n=1 Tax=Paracidovorax anthurii TaxID=78229 RepID=A0A328ZGX5_9BURK|nr:hypothetical protein AX018_100754 [Paracidovorax anthurii]
MHAHTAAARGTARAAAPFQRWLIERLAGLAGAR